MRQGAVLYAHSCSSSHVCPHFLTPFQEKLGSDGNLTIHTKGQLSDIIAHTHVLGMQALNQGELFGDKAHFCIAEDALKQAWNLSRLVRPEDDHREIAQVWRSV